MSKTVRYIGAGIFGVIALGLAALAVRSYIKEQREIEALAEEAKDNAQREAHLENAEDIPVRLEDRDPVEDETEAENDAQNALRESLATAESLKDAGYQDITDPSVEPDGHEFDTSALEGHFYFLGKGEDELEPFSQDYRDLVNQYYEQSLTDPDVTLYFAGKTYGLGAAGVIVERVNVEEEDDNNTASGDYNIRAYDAVAIEKLRNKMIKKENDKKYSFECLAIKWGSM